MIIDFYAKIPNQNFYNSQTQYIKYIMDYPILSYIVFNTVYLYYTNHNTTYTHNTHNTHNTHTQYTQYTQYTNLDTYIGICLLYTQIYLIYDILQIKISIYNILCISIVSCIISNNNDYLSIFIYNLASRKKSCFAFIIETCIKLTIIEKLCLVLTDFN
jgi:hypothetical protein